MAQQPLRQSAFALYSPRLPSETSRENVGKATLSSNTSSYPLLQPHPSPYHTIPIPPPTTPYVLITPLLTRVLAILEATDDRCATLSSRSRKEPPPHFETAQHPTPCWFGEYHIDASRRSTLVIASLDSHRNRFALGYYRQGWNASDYDPSQSSMDPSNRHDGAAVSSPISPLQPLTYDPFAAKRPLITTNFEQYAANSKINASVGEDRPEDFSSDPHGYYRQYQDPLLIETMEGSRQPNIVGTKRQDRMSPSRQQTRPNLSQSRTNGTKFPSLSSRMQSNYTSRYQQSPSSAGNSPLSATKSSPSLSNTARNRQTSLRDLVNKFNQNPDEVPPLPKKAQSRSPSTGSNPHTSGYGRARTYSQPKVPGQTQSYNAQQRRGQNEEDGYAIPTSPISPRTRRSTTDGYASQSMTNLSHGNGSVTRKPLFGEIVALNDNDLNPGYGIPAPRRRRGSEGSMHSPNPMFPNERRRLAQSPPPSSPSAWYKGHTPTLEEIKQEKAIPELPHSMHRRTRSDFTGAPSGPPTRPHTAFQTAPEDVPSSPTAHAPPRRDSQSRIPLSSQRLSLTSDSDNSTPSTWTSSSLNRHPAQILSPPKGTSALPIPSQKPRTPQGNTQSPSSRKSPRRGEVARNTQRTSTSPRLAAFISAPLPKKSPPLRSSRPRQPVSSASTSASRARATDKCSTYENGSPRGHREHNHRRLPELGGVDFAARREKIQRAFTKSVRAEERRRASIAQEAHTQEESKSASDGTDGTQEEVSPNDTGLQNLEETPPRTVENGQGEVFPTQGEGVPKTERDLTINTGHLSERSVLDLSQEDSPTLGVLGRFTSLNRVSEDEMTPTSDIEPSSAVTAGTSDSVDTFFDDEPQEEEDEIEAQESEPDQKHSQPEHKTLLSHIMSMRDRSPASPTSVRQPRQEEETSSERDDRESIQIMLGETPVLERPPPIDQVQEHGSKEHSASDAPGSRWSTSSWTSSIKSKDAEPPVKRVGEHSPPDSCQRDPAHLSVSTATSESTPQPWSPATFTSPQTDRSTLDSDAYSTINRVLDHYHDPNVVSPRLMHDVQQHIIAQSPDLARQGGWDPKKVTQLYLQQLARERAVTRGSNLPDPHKYRRKPVNMQSPTSAPRAPEKDARNEKILSPPESTSHTRNTSLDVEDGDFTLTHRASMNHPEDWAMSPSIADWIAPQAEDSPSDERPPVSAITQERAGQELAELDDQDTSVASKEYHPQLPEIRGAGEPLGLAINITSPQDDDSPTVPPPLPDHVPPPPPIEPPAHTQPSPQMPVPQHPSTIVRNKQVISDTRHSRIAVDVPSLPAQDSNESSRQSGTTTSSIQPSGSSFSQGRPSVETQPTSFESVKPDPVEQKRLIKRRHIIKELVDTEHSFGQDMKVVDDIYKGTSNVIIISAEDVKTLFGNSDQVVAFSTHFLDALKQAAKSVYVLPKSKRWRSNRESNMTTNSLGTDDQSSLNGVELSDDDKDRRTFIGEAFGSHMAQMEKVYADYLKNHDAANQKLQILQKNEKVQIWLKECRAYAHDLTSAWDLDSLLVKPVQRILKYPLLLDQLLETTPENHPDFAKLDIAAREMKGISFRINEMKKRADIMEQVTNTRKRKDSDVRIGLSKAFGRRTERLRQQVGLSDMVEDIQYSAVSEKFGSHFFQLQVVMRDVEMYTNDVQSFMRRFLDFATAMEEHIDVGQTSYPEAESKWRKFRMAMTEMTVTALSDHVSLPFCACVNVYFELNCA